MAEATKQPHLATVSIKLPLFWPSDPQLYMWLPPSSTGTVWRNHEPDNNV